MARGIEFLINNLAADTARNLVPSNNSENLLIELPPAEIGSENGAVFFELDWQNHQAEGLRQRLTTNFSDAPAAQNPTDDLTNRTFNEPDIKANELLNRLKNNGDFAEFRDSPKNLRQPIRQLSEPVIVRDENGNQLQTTSRFDEPAAKTKEQDLSLTKSAEPVPPNEKNDFQARFQPEQTSGANVSKIIVETGTAPDETAPARFREDSTNNAGRIADFHGDKSPLPGKTTAVQVEKILLGAKNEPKSGAKNVPTDETVASAPRNSKMFTAAKAASPNAAPENLPKSAPADFAAAKTIKPENSVGGKLNFTAVEDKTSVDASVRHDGAVEIGGALINNAFAAVENRKNSENQKIRDSETGGNIYGVTGRFTAGANGAMFGAVVGKAISGAGICVGGVLGFVSGAVVGVEPDSGLRWLGAGEINFRTLPDGENALNQPQLTSEHFSPSGAKMLLIAA